MAVFSSSTALGGKARKFTMARPPRMAASWGASCLMKMARKPSR